MCINNNNDTTKINKRRVKKGDCIVEKNVYKL